MRVMPANNRAMVIGYLAGKYPGRLGHLYSITGSEKPLEWLPYALDNGRFPCWSNGRDWDEVAYLSMLDRMAESGISPLWALVPDVVADRDATLREWDIWAPKLEKFNWCLAMAVQDGMRHEDVPAEADVVFIGGSTEWKRRTMNDWCDAFPRVHVGRINTNRWLWECHEAGAESCDGTGWMRGCQRQFSGLVAYLEMAASGMKNPRGAKLWT